MIKSIIRGSYLSCKFAVKSLWTAFIAFAAVCTILNFFTNLIVNYKMLNVITKAEHHMGAIQWWLPIIKRFLGVSGSLINLH